MNSRPFQNVNESIETAIQLLKGNMTDNEFVLKCVSMFMSTLCSNDQHMEILWKYSSQNDFKIAVDELYLCKASPPEIVDTRTNELLQKELCYVVAMSAAKRSPEFVGKELNAFRERREKEEVQQVRQIMNLMQRILERPLFRKMLFEKTELIEAMPTFEDKYAVVEEIYRRLMARNL